MIETIRGIVIRTVKYNDNKQIVDLYSETHGCLSFSTPISRRGRKTGLSAALWRPLTFVECQLEIRPSSRLSKLHDARVYLIYTDIPFNPVKSAVILFLSEFLSHVLRIEQADPLLYRYLETALQWFDACTSGVSNFHLSFLLHLTTFEGVRPDLHHDPVPSYFDLRSGCYARIRPSHPDVLEPSESRYLPYLFRMDLGSLSRYRFSRQQRQRILEVVNLYFRLHLPPFPELRSIAVLKEVFD